MKKNFEIKTIDKFCESEYKEKGSRFIAQVFPAANEDEVSIHLNETKKKYYSATHYCFAYKFQSDKTKYSDAGEPKGTAGIRILNAVEHFGLSYILVIVIRYFGGTKLGVGPLGKAYYNSAFQVLQKAKIITKFLYTKVIIETDFYFLSEIKNILSKHEIKISEIQYGEKIKLVCLIKPEIIENITLRINDSTKGTAVIKASGNIYS